MYLLFPGSDGSVGTVEEGRKIAKEIGYPIMAKAAAGGGGRGMRLIKGEEEFDHLFMAASSEALAAFGDGTMLIDVQLRTSEHRSMYSYVRLSIDRCTATYV